MTNIYEPAAQVCERIAGKEFHPWNTKKFLAAAEQIRALPNPPPAPEKVLPVFTEEWISSLQSRYLSQSSIAGLKNWWQIIAKAINARIAEAGFAQQDAKNQEDAPMQGDKNGCGPEVQSVRKVVQLAPTENAFAVLCNDGSIWEQYDNGRRWKQLPPIPQPGDAP